jgi:hypothetical protein
MTGAGKSRSGSETRKKSIPVTSRYDEAEFAELEEAASRAGLTRASYQRVQSLAAPKTRSTRRAPIDREMLAKLLGQLGKIGSNLNQITRAANSGGTLTGEIHAVIAEIRALVPLISEALTRKAKPARPAELPPRPHRPNYRLLRTPPADGSNGGTAP